MESRSGVTTTFEEEVICCGSAAIRTSFKKTSKNHLRKVL